MAYNAKVGSFNIDTSKTVGQTQAVTGVGFTPKIVMFWWSGTTATSDGARGEDTNAGFGAVSGASARFAVQHGVDDANATSTSGGIGTVESCIVSCLNGTTTADGKADWGSFDSDGFTLTIDDQFSTALRVSYLALGGDDLTNIAVSSFAQATSTGNYSITGVGFQPTCLITVSTNGNNAESLTNQLSLGMATGASNQGLVAGADQTGQATINSGGYGYNGEIAGEVTAGGMFNRSAFVSFDSDGFTLNKLEGTNGRRVYYVALKGGQYLVGDLTTRTDGADIVETEPGFEPVALLFGSANRPLSTQDTRTDHQALSIGAATSTTERAAMAIWNEDNLDDSETSTANYDTAVYAHVRDDAIAALMDIKSIDSGGFTAVMDDTEPSVGSWVTYLAIGASSAPAATIEQEGFRFRNDDGDEDAATWLEDQDTDATVTVDTNFRLRTLLNATGDLASSAFQLEYRSGSDAPWRKVE